MSDEGKGVLLLMVLILLVFFVWLPRPSNKENNPELKKSEVIYQYGYYTSARNLGTELNLKQVDSLYKIDSVRFRRQMENL